MHEKRSRLELPLSLEPEVSNLREFDPVFFLNGNSTTETKLLAIGCRHRLASPDFDSLKEFVQSNRDWCFGYLSYDAKNQLEKLESKNPAAHNLSDVDFVVPQVVFEFNNKNCFVNYFESDFTEGEILELCDDICSKSGSTKPHPQIIFTPGISKDQYLQKITQLKGEIKYGNIYEANFCQQFTSSCTIDPYSTYDRLNEISPTPFSAFMRMEDFYLLCASPERYIKKTGQTVLSQPIKGTIHRGRNQLEDEALKAQLKASKKDRQENVMIVDLVRNDLSRIAEPKSVRVDELFGIYSFPQVHQMISTVSCQIAAEINPVDVLKATFPMGSMTGAPKIKAMELIEEHESFKREIYSGAIGYFTPDGDFDFNVVIRSLLYSSNQGLLSFAVGGAITDGSDPESEYEESLLKAKAIFDLFR